MNTFSLSFAVDDDGESRLVASLDTGDFKGTCFYWCPPDEFANLVAALKVYPIAAENPIDGCWYGGCIALRIEPINSVGALSVQVALQDFGNDWNRCQSQFHARYGDLDRFREQLEAAVASGLGDAVLSAA
ncbi:hypothetical protein V6U71_00705 [Sphingopyxis sp. J-6]|uniref:hypothetical protein n=1 Tax=Sphingopyxis sp. J-6 TaxID=3122054 RepID=UPI003984476F